MPRHLLVALTIASAMVSLIACGSPTRSVATYCAYFYDQGGRLRERWIRSGENASQNPLAGLATASAALPEIASFMHELSLRAPEDIAPDVQTLATALKRSAEQEASAASNPLGSLLGGLLSGPAMSAAEQRVNIYTLRTCGVPPGTRGGTGSA